MKRILWISALAALVVAAVSLRFSVLITVALASRWIALSLLFAYGCLRRTLTTWIVIAMFLGAEIGHDIPALANNLRVVSLIFLQLIKTIIAPGLKARLLGVEGWYSTNILGNRDGEVLDDPESFKTKEESKKSVLDYILQPNLYPELYDKLCHVVRINY